MDNISQMCPTGISVEEPYYITYKGVEYEFQTDDFLWMINNYEEYPKVAEFWDKLIKKTNSTDILTLKEIKDRFYDEFDDEDLECNGYATLFYHKLFNIIMLE